MEIDTPMANLCGLSNEKSVRLNVRGLHGSAHEVQVQSSMSLWRLRGELQARGILEPPGSQQKLVLSREDGAPVVLQASTVTVEEAGIKPNDKSQECVQRHLSSTPTPGMQICNDVLLVLPIRPVPKIPEPAHEPAADEHAINAAIDEECRLRRETGAAMPNDFPVPVTLLDPASRLAGLFSSTAAFEARLRQPVEANPTLLQQLTEMGFPQARARHALVLHRNRLEAAAEWLLEHPEEEAGEPSSGEPTAGAEGATPGLVPSVAVSDHSQQTPLSPASSAASLAAVAEGARGGDVVDLWEAANTALRSGLTNVHVRQAIAEMRENPQAIYRYLDDPEVGPILGSFIRAAGTSS